MWRKPGNSCACAKVATENVEESSIPQPSNQIFLDICNIQIYMYIYTYIRILYNISYQNFKILMQSPIFDLHLQVSFRHGPSH